jgi:hypothetical protein
LAYLIGINGHHMGAYVACETLRNALSTPDQSRHVTRDAISWMYSQRENLRLIVMAARALGEGCRRSFTLLQLNHAGMGIMTLNAV